MQKKAPQRAVSFWPSNGFARAGITEAWLVGKTIENDNKIPEVFDSDILKHARESYRSEPLEIRAPRVIAMHLGAQEKPVPARVLMRRLLALSKRDPTTHLWLINDYATLDDADNMLVHYDMILRSSSEATALLIPALVGAVEIPELIAPMKKMLLRQPDWALYFWRQVPRLPATLKNAALLRSALAQEGVDNPAKNDPLILRSLVADKHFAEAMTLYKTLAVNERNGDPVGNFSDNLPPFDWTFVSTGDFGGSIDRANGVLQVSALSKAGGMVAQKLVHMDAALYELQVKNADALPSKGKLSANITCAEQSEDRISATIQISEQNLKQKISTPSDQCNFYWLTLSIDNTENSAAANYQITDIRLKQLN